MARAVHRDMLTLFDHMIEVEGVPATEESLRLAHTGEYIARVERRCREAAEAGTVLPLEGDVVVSGASFDAVRAAVGCVETAVEQVGARQARNAFCAVRPPGHGAGPDGPGAFGIFNSVAIAALRLLRGAPARRVLVVAWGSRPGSGTGRILAGEPGARFLSLHHLRRADSGTAMPPEVIVRPLPNDSGLAAVLAELLSGLDEATRDFTPDFILLSLGCDALASDPLGALGLAPGDYFDLTVALRQRAEELCEGRLVSVLEEGYDAEASGRAVVQHLRALAGLERAGD